MLVLLILSLGGIGCSNEILDPKQIGRFQPVPVVNVILDSLGVAEEPDPTYTGTEEPQPEDLISYRQDYAFAVGDTIRITIYELQQEGSTYVNDFRVSETGRISIPEVGQLRAIGLTEKKLEDELKKAGLRGRFKTMVGGAPVTQRWANKIGADAFAENAASCVRLAKELIGV